MMTLPNRWTPYTIVEPLPMPNFIPFWNIKCNKITNFIYKYVILSLWKLLNVITVTCLSMAWWAALILDTLTSPAEQYFCPTVKLTQDILKHLRNFCKPLTTIIDLGITASDIDSRDSFFFSKQFELKI